MHNDGLKIKIFEFLTKFVIFWHPWHPWVCVRSDLKQIWAIPPTVYVCPILQKHVVDQICKTDATWEKTGVLYCLFDTP